MTSSQTRGLGYGTTLAFAAIVGMPALLAAVGFMAGILQAVLYNGLSRFHGGIAIRFTG